ncbi:MAG: hypothetical protein RL335_1046 [Bacteroidota bacterium]
MNYLSKYKIPALIALAMLSLTSCLKDEGFENGTYGLNGIGGSFVSVPASASNPVALSLESASGDQDMTLFTVNYESAEKAPEDIKVTLAKDDAAAGTLAGATLVPASVLTFSAGEPSVTVAKGTRVSSAFKCKINTSTLDPNKAYALAFTIKSVSKSGVGIPSNLKTVIYKIALKNKWDGVYTVTGPVTDVANATITQWNGWTAYLETTGPNTCAVRDMSYTGDIFHPIKAGGASSYYGAFGMIVTFDNATNKVTKVESPYVPAANTRYAEIAAGFDSNGTPKKSIRVKYYMFQPSVVPLPSPRVTFDETWTYVKPR